MVVDLPTPGTPVMPTCMALPASGISSISSCWACLAVVGAGRLDEGDGPRQRGAVAAADGRGQARRWSRPSSRVCSPSRSASFCSRPIAASAITVPGGKIAVAPAAYSSSKSPGGMTPPTTIMMSGRPDLGQRVAQRGHQGQMPGGQRRHPDDVHVVVGGLARHLVRCGEQRADVDVEADVGERGGDHLLAAVVAVLAHLGDQDARPAAVCLGELLDQFGCGMRYCWPFRLRPGRPRRWCGSRPGGARRPSPARRRSRRRWPWPGRR